MPKNKVLKNPAIQLSILCDPLPDEAMRTIDTVVIAHFADQTKPYVNSPEYGHPEDVLHDWLFYAVEAAFVDINGENGDEFKYLVLPRGDIPGLSITIREEDTWFIAETLEDYYDVLLFGGDVKLTAEQEEVRTKLIDLAKKCVVSETVSKLNEKVKALKTELRRVERQIEAAKATGEDDG